jgi:hypothetical protein
LDDGSRELGDDVIARLSPRTGDVESLDVLFLSTRLLRSHLFELPVTAHLHRVGSRSACPTRRRRLVSSALPV